MRLFDSLGHLTPVMLTLPSRVWKRGTVWPDVLTEAEAERWANLLINLPKLKGIAFPRTPIPGVLEDIREVQLHVLADASTVSFVSVPYTSNLQGLSPIYTKFAKANNNIAPVKVKKTIPRLELVSIEPGAHLAVNV